MAVSRRRSGYNYVDSATSARGQPKTVYPPDGYCMIETDLHRATTPLQASSRFRHRLQGLIYNPTWVLLSRAESAQSSRKCHFDAMEYICQAWDGNK